MSPKQAMIECLTTEKLTFYRIAKMLNVQYVMPKKWHTNEVKSMNIHIAKRLFDLTGIEISPEYINENKTKKYA